VANMLKLFRSGAVGFFDWLGAVLRLFTFGIGLYRNSFQIILQDESAAKP